MGAAFLCIDVVDVAEDVFLVSVVVLECDFNNSGIPFTVNIDRLLEQA